ncbi:response regulator, partial [Sedimenticola sp.]|uniref:response regulator n=1 Tax=Sedimenticola sp. TaxID=1940285 RepID=UPI003D104912
MKILIAEDDPMIQWVHQSMMTQWGYDYDLADNGYAALELARSNAGCYDLALMDVEMPCLPDKLLQDIHLLAVKQYRLRQLPEGGCHLSEERPVDKRHAEELRELAKKD